MKEKTSLIRLIASSLFGALMACAVVMISIPEWLYIIVLILSGALIALITLSFVKARNILRFFVSFITIETLLGGFVSFLFSYLDSQLSGILFPVASESYNSKLLLMSLCVILCYGIIKLIFLVLKPLKYEEKYEIEVCIYDISFRLQALLDTGNLVLDPLDSKPVLLVKKIVLPDALSAFDINNIDSYTAKLKSRFRIIPIKTPTGEKILTGFRADHVIVSSEKYKKKFDAVFAIDDEDGLFGEYEALIPASLADL